MSGMNWDDLRVLLALSRAGSFAEAAQRLGCDETTVARRLHALSHQVGAPLTIRLQGGTTLTDLGRRLSRHAERMEAEALEIIEDSACLTHTISGEVRVTAVPFIVTHLLVPALPRFLNLHPNLHITLLPDPNTLDLSRREADLALRLGRPMIGGLDRIGRRLPDLGQAVYAARDAGPDLPWIGYAPHLPQSAFMARVAPAPPRMTVGDVSAALGLVTLGIGKALLPRAIATPDLVELPMEIQPPSRQLWILQHRAQSKFARIRAVMDWLDTVDWR